MNSQAAEVGWMIYLVVPIIWVLLLCAFNILLRALERRSEAFSKWVHGAEWRTVLVSVIVGGFMPGAIILLSTLFDYGERNGRLQIDQGFLRMDSGGYALKLAVLDPLRDKSKGGCLYIVVKDAQKVGEWDIEHLRFDEWEGPWTRTAHKVKGTFIIEKKGANVRCEVHHWREGRFLVVLDGKIIKSVLDGKGNCVLVNFKANTPAGRVRFVQLPKALNVEEVQQHSKVKKYIEEQ